MHRVNWGIGIVAAALVQGTATLARAGGVGQDYGHEMMWGSWGWGMVLGPIMMIVFVAVIIAVVVLIVRALSGPSQGGSMLPPPGPSRTPLDIVKERYARGEIDKEEYEEKRRALGE